MGGLIYLIGNISLKEERIKIGKSKSNPNEFRKDELHSIGVPEPFVVECPAFVDDHRCCWENYPKKLESFRPNKQREFFSCTISPQLLAIRQFTVNLWDFIWCCNPNFVAPFTNMFKRPFEMFLPKWLANDKWV